MSSTNRLDARRWRRHPLGYVVLWLLIAVGGVYVLPLGVGGWMDFCFLSIPLAAIWLGIGWGWVGFRVAVGWIAVCTLLLFARSGSHPAAFCLVTGMAGLAISAYAADLRARFDRVRAGALASEERYQQLVEKSLAGVFVYREDRILYANSRFKEIVGHPPEEVIGRTFWEFIHPEDRAKVKAQIARRGSEGQSDLHYECRLTAKDGGVVWVEVVSSPAEFEGLPAVLVSAHNITSRKMIEEQRRELSKLAQKQEEQLVHSTRLAEMGEMAAGVAHELNQPLTGIKNFAKNATYMLEEGEGNLGEVKENLRLISGQVDRASKIISQMRELARRTERNVALVDVNNTLRESVEFVMPQMRLSGVEVTFTPDPKLPLVMGDRIRLEQVFLNLLTNARHAMEETPERNLYVTTRYEHGTECPVVLEIRDTGKGFAPDVVEKLFTPFFSTKSPGHGTGLGLSISLGIIKDHKGTIEAKGVEGHGASFTVRLPAS